MAQMARTIRDPSGAEWRIRRRWLSRPLRRPRFARLRRGRGSSTSWLDVGDLGGADGVFAYVALVVLVIVVLVVFVLFVWPLLLALADAVVILLAAVAAAVGRLAMGRPWTIEAVRSGCAAERLEWRVNGWRRSGRVIEDIAAALSRGESQPRPTDAVAV
jgi:hypothetical protein